MNPVRSLTRSATAFLTSAVFAIGATPDSSSPLFESDVLPLLREYCYDCHDAGIRKSGLDLEQFSDFTTTLSQRALWGGVLDKIESRQMPPPNDEFQPSEAERRRLVEWIVHLAGQPDPHLAARDPGKPLLRRLTRLEYNNTVRDLLGLSTDVFMFPERLPFAHKDYFDPAKGGLGDVVEVALREQGNKYPVLLPSSGLPGDNRAAHGYRNRGDANNLSPLLLEQYVALAGEIASHPDLARRSAAFAALVGIDPATLPRPAAAARERITAFLERAFRRPPTADELALYVELWQSAIRSGKDDEAAGRLLLQAALTSPHLLYISESADLASGSVRPLNDHELATRLAYFLWASTPDDALLAEARAGRLREPAVLEEQARRMLRDPRARELSEGFATQWLRLDQLSTAKPDTDLFQEFYSGPQGKNTLHGAMLVEALLLFETVMVEDRSILDFIGAEYTWLNPRLAELYGMAPTTVAPLPPPPGASNREIREAANKVANTWVRTPLPDPTRGGFITMAGPLTVTSFPFRTSPVKRGAWLLETIFNRPPQEPAVAFAIENDTKEEAATQSIREKFEAHRNQAACYSCHVRLDPPGFALERFDPIGRWRETDGGQPVDARGEWNGESFDGPAGYKQALMRAPGEFTRGFVEHLLGYALARKLGLYDLPAVAEIERAAAADGHRFSQIVVGIVQSYPFRHTRNLDAGEDGSSQ